LPSQIQKICGAYDFEDGERYVGRLEDCRNAKSDSGNVNKQPRAKSEGYEYAIWTRLVVGMLVLVVVPAFAQAQRTHGEEASSIKVLRDIAYREGDSEAWRLDLAMPAEQTEELRPALVIVHGGGWRGGSRTVDVFQKMMTDYAQKGYVTINIDYRLTGEAPFPACIEDVKCAVRWLRAHAEEYHVDPNRIGAYGHSAGAHLALMLAMASKSAGLEGDGGWEEYSSIVNAVAAGSPPTELGRDVPMAKSEWWPIGYIAANHPPMLLIQGGADPIVRPELTEDFVEKMVEKMKAAGAKVEFEYLKIDGAGHSVPEKNAGGERFQFGLGFELYNEHKKPVPEVSNSAFAWGGLMGTAYIIDPERDLIALLYINMYNNEPVYPEFLSKAYQLFAE
jgi:acetyl esterase/lipase